MGGKLWRPAAGAAWWVIKIFASMLLGAAVIGAVGLVLGLLSDSFGASQALQVGALVGAAFGVMAAASGSGSPGLRWGPSERHYYRPKGRDER